MIVEPRHAVTGRHVVLDLHVVTDDGISAKEDVLPQRVD